VTTADQNSMPNDVRLVNGEIVFGEGDKAFSEATAYVWLEEASRADAPSHVVAEQTIRHVAYQPGQPGRLAFDLHGPAADEHIRYVVRAHLDVDSDGEVSRGDYISMESYPVLTFGYPRHVTVRLRKV
jgi:uncharacterized lipoprotein YbaY